MRFQSIVDGMRSGRAWAVLVGAGPSSGVGLPDWIKLIRDLEGLGGPGIPDDLAASTLPTALGRTLNAVGTEAFWNAVRTLLCDENHPIPEVYRLLPNLPFHVLATTNYDHLLRRVVESSDQDDLGDPRVVWYPFTLPAHLDQRRLVHLHGCCEQIATRSSGISPQVVLTQDQYDTAYVPGGSLSVVLSRLFSDFQVLVVGTSLEDGRLTAVLNQARYGFEQQGRFGAPLPSGRHLALTASKVKESRKTDIDFTWPGTAIGIEPIFYYDPIDDHKGLVEALRYLTRSLGPSTSAQYDVDQHE